MFMPQPSYLSHSEDSHSLASAQSGAKLRVRSLNGDKVLCSRLLSLGLTPGCEIEICPNSSPSGSRKITLRNSSLIITEDIAKAIICSPL